MVGLVLRRAGADELSALGEVAAARRDRCDAAAGEPLGDGPWLVRAAARGREASSHAVSTSVTARLRPTASTSSSSGSAT